MTDGGDGDGPQPRTFFGCDGGGTVLTRKHPRFSLLEMRIALWRLSHVTDLKQSTTHGNNCRSAS